MGKAYLLTEDDVRTLRAVLAAVKGRRQNTTGRPGPWEDDPTSPEMYAAKTPSGGIPAMAGVTPGSADCEIYRLIPSGAVWVLESMGAADKEVFSLAATEVAGNEWVLVQRDKHGRWWVSGTGSTSPTGGGGGGSGGCGCCWVAALDGGCLRLTVTAAVGLCSCWGTAQTLDLVYDESLDVWISDDDLLTCCGESRAFFYVDDYGQPHLGLYDTFDQCIAGTGSYGNSPRYEFTLDCCAANKAWFCGGTDVLCDGTADPDGPAYNTVRLLVEWVGDTCETACCPGVVVPAELTLTVNGTAGAGGSAACFNDLDQTLTLRYQTFDAAGLFCGAVGVPLDSQPGWVSTTPMTGFGVGPKTILLHCDDNGDWTLCFADGSNCPVTFGTETCDPFFLERVGVVLIPPCTCGLSGNNTLTFTVTE